MSSLRIISVSSQKLVTAGQARLAALLAQHQDKPVLFLSSGGSCLQLLELPLSPLPKNLTIGVLDERFSTEETVNNCAQIIKTSFVQDACIHGAHLIDTRPKTSDTPETLAERFETCLREWKESYPEGTTIATLGMATDGHTAGIFPDPDNTAAFRDRFLNPSRWVTHYNAGDQTPYPQRITTTIPFLKQIDTILVFVRGEEKATTLATVLDERTPLEAAPAGIIRKLKSVTLLTDALL